MEKPTMKLITPNKVCQLQSVATHDSVDEK